jgi:hypothetical protein
MIVRERRIASLRAPSRRRNDARVMHERELARRPGVATVETRPPPTARRLVGAADAETLPQRGPARREAPSSSPAQCTRTSDHYITFVARAVARNLGGHLTGCDGVVTRRSRLYFELRRLCLFWTTSPIRQPALAPHPRHGTRPLRLRTLALGLGPSRSRKSGVNSATRCRRRNRPAATPPARSSARGRLWDDAKFF